MWENHNNLTYFKNVFRYNKIYIYYMENSHYNQYENNIEIHNESKSDFGQWLQTYRMLALVGILLVKVKVKNFY